MAPKKQRIPADTFAHRLMLVRADAGYLTVKDAADRCGLNYGSWSNWERGSTPRDLLDVVQRISDALDIDYDWLLFGSAGRGRRAVTTRYAQDGRAEALSPTGSSRNRRPGGPSRPPNVASATTRPAILRRPNAA